MIFRHIDIIRVNSAEIIITDGTIMGTIMKETMNIEEIMDIIVIIPGIIITTITGDVIAAAVNLLQRGKQEGLETIPFLVYYRK